MFQILIADDEQAVIQSLQELIDWEELGFELAGAAVNGYEAAGIAESRKVDIAILDIRMPGINGLDLCKILKKKNPAIQIIIISGYAEFEYARKAIAYGVLGYCLKPVEYAKIVKYLLKAKQNLTKGHGEGHEELLEALEEGDLETVRVILAGYGFHDKQYYAAVSAGETAISLTAEDGIAVRMGRGVWGYILKHHYFLERQEMEESWGLGYLNEPVYAEELYQALDDCTAMAYQYFADSSSRVCNTLDHEKANVWLDEIQQYLQKHKWDIICSRLQELKQHHLPDFSVRSSLKLCNMIYSSDLFRNDAEDYYVYGLKQLVMQYGSLSHMIDEICRSVYQARNSEENENVYSNTSFLKLIKYVDQNYTGNITLTSAAEVLHMNPNYISQLFKKEAGITFVHYIIQKRLDDAKVLLATTQKTVVNIAEEVGFNDYFYFLKTFKKFIGMTPGQYRMKE